MTASSTTTPDHLPLDAVGDAVFVVDTAGLVVSMSTMTEKLLGDVASVATTVPVLMLFDAADREIVTQSLAADLPAKSFQARMRTQKGSVWMSWRSVLAQPNGKPLRFLIGRDASEHMQAFAHMEHMAMHDSLTGLPNRAQLDVRVKELMAQVAGTQEKFSLAVIDLDGFKKVNDALGHPVGDDLLKQAAARIREALRESDIVARLGGDEFVLLLPGLYAADDIQDVGRRIISALSLPFILNGQAVYVGASLGAATYPLHAENSVRLLANADTALYRAKHDGKGRLCIYSKDWSDIDGEHVSIESAMFEGISNGEFMLHYQPIVNAKTGLISGAEALMRWMRPGVGMMPPAKFIPMAESNGLISLLGAWALRAACMQLRRIQDETGTNLYVSVNVSPRQFRDTNFVGLVGDALATAKLTGAHLQLEITEGTLMSDPERSARILEGLAAQGVRIAVDDFGTGYSSLAYLTKFPITALKIDRAFIKDLPAAEKDGVICSAVCSLARELNMSTVAEGVETAEQLQLLKDKGCTYIQGYYTGKPMPADVLMSVLRNERAIPTHRVSAVAVA